MAWFERKKRWGGGGGIFFLISKYVKLQSKLGFTIF